MADGTLTAVCRGVFEASLVADDLTPLARATTAIPQSALSYQTAAPIHTFPVPPVPEVHVTAPYGSGRFLSATIVHETRDLEPADIVVSPDGFPVTSPARTLVDLAAAVSEQRLRHLVRAQTAVGTPTLHELQACFLRLARRGRRGVANLREVLDDLAPDAPSFSQSELEARVWGELGQRGISGFTPQFKPSWFDGRRGIVDFAHRRAAVILEADGRRWHARHESMVEDRRRDRTAAANGWLVVRLMWEDVVDRSDDTFAELAAIIDSRLATRTAELPAPRAG